MHAGPCTQAFHMRTTTSRESVALHPDGEAHKILIRGNEISRLHQCSEQD